LNALDRAGLTRDSNSVLEGPCEEAAAARVRAGAFDELGFGARIAQLRLRKIEAQRRSRVALHSLAHDCLSSNHHVAVVGFALVAPSKHSVGDTRRGVLNRQVIDFERENTLQSLASDQPVSDH
jgi:hypothetical protein